MKYSFTVSFHPMVHIIHTAAHELPFDERVDFFNAPVGVVFARAWMQLGLNRAMGLWDKGAKPQEDQRS